MPKRPFRWEPRILSGMSTDAIVSKMKKLVPGFDLNEFIMKTGRYLSSEDLAEKEYYPVATFSSEDEDFIWMACKELWKRLIPDRPAADIVADQFNDRLQEFEKAEDKGNWELAVQIGREAFKIIYTNIIEETPDGYRLRQEFYEKLVHSSLYDIDSFLDNFVAMLCDTKEYEEALNIADMLTKAFNNVSFLCYKVESLFALGRKDEAEQCCQEWIEHDPKDVWPYIHAGDGFLWYKDKDYARAKSYYLKALDVARANSGTPDSRTNLEAVYERLFDLAEDTGNHIEKIRYQRQLDALRSKARAKIGRNDPCPCGSGKKYKKCCGRVEMEAPKPSFDRRLIERDLLGLKQTLEAKNFNSVEEVNEYLREINKNGKIPQWKPKTPLEQAQNLIFEALETTGKKRLELVEQALKISADCADAYVLLAEEKAESPEEALQLYEAGMKAGERTLGKEIFEKEAGSFWGMVETRPYMRARLGVAQCLWALGKVDEAIGHFRELLRLNPNDNQGVRYLLALALLNMKKYNDLEKLLLQYDEATAHWLFTKALVAFIRQGDTAESRNLLREAMKANSHVASYILGQKKLPRMLPERVGFGDESEAVTYAVDFGSGWHSIEGAVDWLASATGIRRGTWQKREKAAGIPEVFLKAFEGKDRKGKLRKSAEDKQEE